MESHEWRERTEDGLRFWRARRHAGRWSFQTTLKSEPDWESVEPVPRDLWASLRGILWNKYQRRRVPWKHIEAIDRMLEDDDSEFPEP